MTSTSAGQNDAPINSVPIASPLRPDSKSVPEQLRHQAKWLALSSKGMLFLAIVTLSLTGYGLGVLGSLFSTSRKDHLDSEQISFQQMVGKPAGNPTGGAGSKAPSRFDELCNQRSIGAPATDVDFLCLESFSLNSKFQTQSAELKKTNDNVRSLLEANQRLQKSEGFQKLLMDQQSSMAKHNYQVELNKQKSDTERLRFSQLTSLVTNLLGRFALVLLGLYAVRVFFERSRRSADRASNLNLAASLIELGLSEHKNAMPLVNSFSASAGVTFDPATVSEPISSDLLKALIEKIPPVNATQKS
jgi:hypothetical protein